MQFNTLTAPLTAAVLLLGTVCSSNGALKERTPSPNTTAQRASRIIVPELEFKDATVAELLGAISAASGIKVFYTITSHQDRNLTLSLRNIPASEAFLLIPGLTGLQFKYEAEGVRFTQR